MLTKQQLFGLLIGLARVNDLSLVNDAKVLSGEVCADHDIPLVQRMAVIIGDLYMGFDYAKSPEFLRSVLDKSEAVRAMRLRLLTPQRRTEMRKRFADVLARIMASDEILDLTDPSCHERVNELRHLISRVSNPGN
jgi:hypothetical protein